MNRGFVFWGGAFLILVLCTACTDMNLGQDPKPHETRTDEKTGQLELLSLPDTALQGAHAHNDYLHDRPLLDALSRGFASIEADVFLVDGELLVGHNLWQLTPERNLRRLYLDPLDRIARQNGGKIFRDHSELRLLVDIKQDGAEVFEKLQQQLREYPDLISSKRDGEYRTRAVRVVISGDRPVAAIQADGEQWTGIDGRLNDLDSQLPVEALPLISANWSSEFKWRGKGEFPDDERTRLNEIVTRAHRAGRAVRFWATPESPTVWKELAAAQVDCINTDRLDQLRQFLLNGTATGGGTRPGPGDPAGETAARLESPIERIAILGCIRQDRPIPALARYRDLNAQLHIWLGDNIYADTTDLEELQKCYATLAAHADFAPLRATGIHMAT